MTPLSHAPSARRSSLNKNASLISPPRVPPAETGDAPQSARLSHEARQISAPTQQRRFGFGPLPRGFDGSKKAINEMAPSVTAVYERRSAISMGLPYQSSRKSSQSKPSLFAQDNLSFQLLNYLPRNRALLDFAETVRDSLEALRELDRHAHAPGVNDLEKLYILRKSHACLVVLHRETRSFIESTAGHSTKGTPRRTERQEQQLVKKLKELKCEATALEARYEELVDQLNPGSSTSTDVSEASEDSSSSSVNQRLDFADMTRFAQSDARSVIVAMGLPIAAHLEALAQQDDIAELETPGSSAWCNAIANGIHRLTRIHDVLNQYGQQYADKGGTNNQFLDWVDQKITDVWDEQEHWIALAQDHAQAMRQNGYQL